MGGEQAYHLLWCLEVAVGEALTAETGCFDGAALANTGDHILQDASLGCVIEHIASGHRGHAGCVGHVGEPVQAHCVAGSAAECQRTVGTVAEIGPEPVQLSCERAVDLVRDKHREQPLAVRSQIGPIQFAATLGRSSFAER